MLSNYIRFVEAHFKFLLVLVAAFVVIHVYSLHVSTQISHDQLVQKSAQAQLATQVSANKELAQQNTALVAEIQKSNEELARAITAAATKAKSQEQRDTTLPLPALASHWAEDIQVTQADIVPTLNGSSLTVNDNAAVKTVQALDSIPALQTSVQAETIIAANNQKVIDAKTAQIDGLNKQIVDDGVSCKAQLTTLKAKSRRSFLRGLKIGTVVGFIGGFFAGHSI